MPATREEVYRAITKPHSWWDKKVEGDAAEQGSEFHYSDDDRYVGFSVQEADGDRVVWTVEPTDNPKEDHEWDDTSLIFDIEEDEGNTKVNFTHRGMRPHDRGYEEIAKTWKDRIAKGLQPLIGREEDA
ncbi:MULTISPECIES: SRPBCC family protein [Corynebacterium]|uniref:SRPBCC family protein n=1 Tax=Corynebacterium TaxID=1716 RepID=UPI0027E2F5C2|nr:MULTISPECIES: SRPBCC domain-containing protein [Corynebacterium]